MNLPFVSVIVPTCGRDESLVGAIEGLFAQDYPHYEVLVIDQSEAHDEKTQRFLKENCARFRYYKFSPPNLPQARNRGADFASGEIILFCDDDVLVGKNFIMAHALNYEDKAVGAVGGKITGSGSESKPLKILPAVIAGGKVGLSGRYFFNWESDKKRFIFSGRGANLSVRKSLFVSLGGFDCRYAGTYAYEDVDFCYRLRNSGYRIIFEPQASLKHLALDKGGCSVGSAAEREYFRLHNAMLFYLKNMNRIFIPVMIFAFIASSVRKCFLGALRPADFTGILEGLYDGYRTYKGARPAASR